MLGYNTGGWGFGGTPYGYGGMGYTTPQPAPPPLKPAAQTPLQMLAYGDDNNNDNLSKGPMGAPSGRAPQTPSWSPYETARRSDTMMKNIGTGTMAASLFDISGLSTLVGIGNKMHGTAVARPQANFAFGAPRGIGGEIPGQRPIGVLQDLLIPDFIRSPFDQHENEATRVNQEWDRSAPEVFDFQGDDNSGGGYADDIDYSDPGAYAQTDEDDWY